MLPNVIVLIAALVSAAVQADETIRLEEMVVHAEEALPLYGSGANLGTALEGTPGIANQSFGPNVGRPVIRGQGGNRVRLLQDGLGAGDLSALSPDHAVAIDPLLAGRVGLLRGPAALAYGSGLLGGAVNVDDGRIPQTLPEKPLSGGARYGYTSPDDAHGGAVRLDAGAGSLGVHLDGSRRHSGDLRTGRGVLDHTGSDRRSGGAGLSWIGESGFLGGSVSRLENHYGVPSFEAVPLDIDLTRTRHQLRAAWYGPAAGVEALDLAFAHNDYRHVEIESGQRGSRWTRRSYEGRVVLRHLPVAGMAGQVGFHSRHGKVAAIGEEAIVPRTKTAS
ncbi:hypothetical protein MIT9_P1015 [Methylomarinovum caldicuralii]|uniref:TonB-dependent receptor plug domain-containing protein n=1 Tax=Methylomarinovum caldicuralii TaxID=438856 RepID=A0AAU9BZD4_9GAMM|nr:TonB-dependent receptor plug domain-containing protein [Methylomarinovum caldicuralii]BCX81437.1 hypothetical protein MIT9_P1015 [Methylomarinovum caldicuralii]